MKVRGAFLGAAMSVLPALANAQTIRGSVVDRADSASVPGVVVLLIDAGGGVAARALTNERGEFRLPAGSPGAYRLRTLRIGFRPVTSEPVMLAAGQELTQQILVAGLPFSLDTVRVQRRSTCRMSADSALVTYAIWEQVRTALTATDLSARARNTFATIVTYERFLNPRSKRVLRQSSTVKSVSATRPWISLSPDSLQRVGYVAEVNSWSVYVAPDLDVLLSGQFLEDHCFRIAESTDSGWVGLAFEPAPHRKRIPEIGGTMWLDRKSSELRRMEFLYTHISREQEDGNAGGEMDFVRTKVGTWVISHWNIRMPVLTQNVFRNEPGNPAMSSEKIIVKELKIGGGELALVTRGKDTLWSRPPVVLAGTVMDSVSGRAAPGARVTLKGTSLEAATDSSGMFRIDGVLPGEYTMQVATQSLDSVAAVSESSVAFTDDAGPVSVRVPSAADVLAKLCPDTLTPEGVHTGLVVGQLRVRGDSSAPRGVGVIAEWLDLSVTKAGMATALLIGRRAQGLDSRTDATGTFRMCGVPVNTAFRIRSALDDTLATPGRIPGDTRFARVDVVVDPQPKAATNVAQESAFAGTVLSSSKREPLRGVEVSLPQLGLSARTNDSGAFRINDVPAGAHVVWLRHVGYAPLTLQLGFVANDITKRQFLLANVQTLDSVIIAATRPALPEFEDRRKLGIGHFLAREELAKQENRRMSEILSRVAGLRIARASGGSQAWVVGGRGMGTAYQPDRTSTALGAQPACYADVWLDGAVVYRGDMAGAMLWDVNSITAGGLEAVEFYANAQTPLRYSRPNMECGVLLLWTRRGSRD
jgi:hypothetical protein